MANGPGSSPGGHNYTSTSAKDGAHQHNGNQTYYIGGVGSFHQGDINTFPSTPIDESGYLTPARYIDRPKNSEALLTASRLGQIQLVEHLLGKKDKDVNYMESSGMAPLHWAVKQGHLEIVRLLLAPRNGANPGLQRKDKKGPTPLIVAAAMGRLNMVELLLDDSNRAPIDSVACLIGNTETSGLIHTTALAEAILHQHIEVVTYLVKHEANVNIDLSINSLDMDTSLLTSYSPLSLAVLTGNVELIATLIQSAPKLRGYAAFPVRSSDWQASRIVPIHGVIESSFWKISSLLVFAVLTPDGLRLLEHLLLRDVEPEQRAEAFKLATLLEKLDLLSCFKKHGLDVNGIHDGRSALHIATECNKQSSIAWLLENGADVRSITVHEPGNLTSGAKVFTFQGTISVRGVNQRISLPYVHLADIEHIAVRTGDSPMHAATASPEALAFLMSRGGNVETVNVQNGSSLLHAAALRIQPETVRLLLSRGASAEAKNMSGQTAYDVAKARAVQDINHRKRHSQVLDLLRPAGERDVDLALRRSPAKLKTDDSSVSGRSREMLPHSKAQSMPSKRPSINSSASSARYLDHGWALSYREGGDRFASHRDR